MSRGKTLSVLVMRREHIAGEETIVEYDRPVVRSDCFGGERPCPFVSCKHHLYLDVTEETGSIKLNFPDVEVEELKETCSLDVADRGGVTLDVVGDVLNITRERVRQIEVRALIKVRSDGDVEDLEDAPHVGESPLAALITPDAENRKAQINLARRRREGRELPEDTEDVGPIPRGHLPPPLSRDLWRCKLCGVRVGEIDRAGHLERHGISDAPDEHFTLDNSVQAPLGRPSIQAMHKLAAKARRARYAVERVDEQRERDVEVTMPLPDEPKRAAPVEAREEMTTMDAEWMSSADAAKELGRSQSYALQMAKNGKIETRKGGSGGLTSPTEFKRTSVAKLKAELPANRLTMPKAPKPDRAALIKQRAATPVAAKPVKPPPKRVATSAPPDDVRAVIRALALVVDLGKLEAADAFAALRELAA